MVGEQVFAHEYGLHADGVWKSPSSYEAFDPQEVGLQRRLVVGKHSGSHGLLHRLEQIGYRPDPLGTQDLPERVRSMSQRNKRPLNDGELPVLCRGLRVRFKERG